MTRSNLFTTYLLLSTINGMVPSVIALLFSVSGLSALLIWGAATVVSFFLICLVCLRSAMSNMISEPDVREFGGELEKATIYR